MRKKLAAGNWKMNGTASQLAEVKTLVAGLATSADVLLCPPATLLDRMTVAADGKIATGAQDCHAAASGAHTGDISCDMIKDAGGTYVILGHSERREDCGEHSDIVRAKARTAQAAGLVAVICIGETLAEREANNTIDILAGQLAGSVPDTTTAENTVVAYEPVWAIGTGKVPTLEQIQEVHDSLRSELTNRFGADIADGIRLLYGGSVKPSNASDIFAVSNVDGALVGGASLKAADFGAIISALG